MTERERIGRLLHAAHGTWRKPHLLRWEDSPDVQDLYMCMADAVIADRTRLTLELVAAALRQEDHACQHGTTCSGQWLADQRTQRDRAP